MSQIKSAIKLLGGLDGPFLAKEIRATLASFEDPALQQEVAFHTADGRLMTVAQVKTHFGPNYATNRTCIEQVAAAYIGRFTRKALEKYGINASSLTPEQMMRVFAVTQGAEQYVIRTLSGN